MAHHNELGKEGEDIAVRYLLGKSYAILERNWRYRKEEIDVICRFNNQIVVVEVKTRAGHPLEPGEKAVTPKKQRALVRAAHAYMQEKEFREEVRFDIIVITKQGELWDLIHIEDAFYAVA